MPCISSYRIRQSQIRVCTRQTSSSRIQIPCAQEITRIGAKFVLSRACRNYTGNSALLRAPANFSKTCLMTGPTTGMFPANWPTVTRKSPNRMKMPYSSIRKPVRGQRSRIRRIPRPKAVVPLSFWRREKKAMVFWRPIIRTRPMRKSIYAMGKRWTVMELHFVGDIQVRLSSLMEIGHTYIPHGKPSQEVSICF